MTTFVSHLAFFLAYNLYQRLTTSNIRKKTFSYVKYYFSKQTRFKANGTLASGKMLYVIKIETDL